MFKPARKFLNMFTIILAIFIVYFGWVSLKENKDDSDIRVSLPIVGSTITSPLIIKGEARGNWFFEGDAPVVLVDWDGLIIAEGYITTKGEWMTEDFVEFEGMLEFETPDTGVSNKGVLILRKDNPSDMPENDDALEIPILFGDVPKVVYDYNSWKDYKNDEYGFTLRHPSDWGVQESLKPQNINALHEIVFHEKDYDTYRADFRISIHTNEEKLSTSEWWEALLEKEDLKKKECVEEYGNTAPCVFLRDLLTKEKDITLGGISAHMAWIFQFDSEKECVYSSHNEHVFEICYAGMDPNDPKFEEHRKITEGIRESFVFEKQIDIIGEWQSIEDNKSIKVFIKDGTIKELYDSEVVGIGKWEIEKRQKGTSLKVQINDEKYLYTILKINNNELELSYLPRGNTLRFKKN